MQEPLYYRAKHQFQTQFKDGQGRALRPEFPLSGLAEKLSGSGQGNAKIINKVVRLLGKYRLPIYDERKTAGVRTVMTAGQERRVSPDDFCDRAQTGLFSSRSRPSG